ncbi:hypothetical protein F511_04938 [Dorcoceras hygrometricum]|uniref:CST complex subunit TEN1 n=1 Tax=Dorcoceras hygrometricum TaxID=472368 RepID=A0A2Z7BKW6_9LAMI|nr:hypothetical protein F511_04938 [Dorcoceras hygrometricum]
MSASAVNAGSLVTLQELNPNSPNFKPGGAFRVTGKLQEYTLETAVAVIIDGDASLKVDTQHLKLDLRPGSLYQFIGELDIEPTNEVIGIYGHLSNDIVHIGILASSAITKTIPWLVFFFQAILKARVGRNVDGLDMNLYHQSLRLLREFQAAQISSWTA